MCTQFFIRAGYSLKDVTVNCADPSFRKFCLTAAMFLQTEYPDSYSDLCEVEVTPEKLSISGIAFDYPSFNLEELGTLDLKKYEDYLASDDDCFNNDEKKEI